MSPGKDLAHWYAAYRRPFLVGDALMFVPPPLM